MHVFLPVGIGVFTILLFSCYFLTVILIHGIYSVQFPHYRISPYHFLQYTLIRNQFIILNCCGQEKLPVIHTYITLSQLRACFKCPEIPALILNSCVQYSRQVMLDSMQDTEKVRQQITTKIKPKQFNPGVKSYESYKFWLYFEAVLQLMLQLGQGRNSVVCRLEII